MGCPLLCSRIERRCPPVDELLLRRQTSWRADKSETGRKMNHALACAAGADLIPGQMGQSHSPLLGVTIGIPPTAARLIGDGRRRGAAHAPRGDQRALERALLCCRLELGRVLCGQRALAVDVNLAALFHQLFWCGGVCVCACVWWLWWEKGWGTSRGRRATMSTRARSTQPTLPTRMTLSTHLARLGLCQLRACVHPALEHRGAYPRTALQQRAIGEQERVGAVG